MRINPPQFVVAVLAASATAIALCAYAKSGLSEVQVKRAFWVVPPFALEQAVSNPKDITLFAGCQSEWYDIWSFSEIEHIGWDEWDVKNVRTYGVHHGLLIYGATSDNRWFIGNTRGGRLPWFYDNEAAWRQAVRVLGGDPGIQLTFEQGYCASRLAQWKWRTIKWGAILALVSLPWIGVLMACRKKWKRTLACGNASRG
jgi:hypothetical protein